MRAEDRPKAAESGRMLMYKQKHDLKRLDKEYHNALLKKLKKDKHKFNVMIRSTARQLLAIIPTYLNQPEEA